MILVQFLLGWMGSVPLAHGLEVRWSAPKLEYSIKRGESFVILRGTARPGLKIKIDTKRVLFLKGEGERAVGLDAKKILPHGAQVEVDQKGEFSIPMLLPHGLVQVPLVVERRSGASRVQRVYQLNIKVEDLVVSFADVKVMQPYSNFRKQQQLWFGFGGNFLDYKQESKDVDLDLSFYNYSAPSVIVDWLIWYREDLELNASLKYSTAPIVGVPDIGLDDNQYEWVHLTAESTFYPETFVFRWRSFQTQLGLRGGLQYQQFPTFERRNGANTEFDMKTLSLSTVSVGMKFLAAQSVYWGFELLLKAQLPLDSPSGITPGLTFDGSLGVMRFNAYKDWNAGLFWYGQYNQMDYKVQDEPTGENISGQETLLYSRLELRMGRSF